jgi:hypothetical protein
MVFKSERGFIIKNTIFIGCIFSILDFIVSGFEEITFFSLIFASAYIVVNFFSKIPIKITISENHIDIVFIKYFFKHEFESYSISELNVYFNDEHVGRGLKVEMMIIKKQQSIILKIQPGYTGWSKKQLQSLFSVVSSVTP